MKKSITITLLFLSLLILLGYIVYDKVLNKDKVVDKVSLIGTYINKSENENSYHDANLTISNDNDTSFYFNLSAVHGMDIDHVNIGNVSGTATKIETNKYEFKEEKDGKENIITFEFSFDKESKDVIITESYPDNINPYAGNNVYFAGKYIKVE